MRYTYKDYKQNTSIYCGANAYGYKLNVNHPKIQALYFRYKAWQGVSVNVPLSDKQRLEFESYVINKYLSPS